MQRGNLIMLNNILNRINMKINLIFISILLFMQMSVLSCGYYQLHSKSIKVTHDEILFQKNDIIINRLKYINKEYPDKFIYNSSEAIRYDNVHIDNNNKRAVVESNLIYRLDYSLVWLVFYNFNGRLIDISPRFHGSAIASPSKKYYAIIESESVLEDTGKIVFYNSNGNEIKTIHLTRGYIDHFNFLKDDLIVASISDVDDKMYIIKNMGKDIIEADIHELSGSYHIFLLNNYIMIIEYPSIESGDLITNIYIFNTEGKMLNNTVYSADLINIQKDKYIINYNNLNNSIEVINSNGNKLIITINNKFGQ